MERITLLATAALVLVACASDPVAAVQPDDGQDGSATDSIPSSFARTLEPCTVPGIAGSTLCGTYTVYEDRSARSGRTIDLNVLVVKALESNAEPDPVVYFEGGPGGSSVDVARFLVDVLPNIRRRRDLVFVDQRGTGASARLACNTTLPGGEASLFGTLFPDDHIRACAARLGVVADLRLYSTPIAVDDIDEVLEWLGYERVNLFGTSYGTRVALVFLRRHPERVRSVIVNGVAPPHVNVHLHDAQNVDRSLEWLFTDCEHDAACSTRFPELRAQFDALVARFEHGPVEVSASLSDGSTATVPFSMGDFGYAVRGMLYGSLAENIPAWVAEATTTGGWSGFPGYYVQRSRWVASNFATGMHLSVFCAEDIPFTTDAEIAALTKDTLLGESLFRRYERACTHWPRGDIPNDYHQLVASEMPVLIISGERDPATPVGWGEEIAAALPNSLHLVIPDAGHVPLTPCVQRINRQFIESGAASGLDASCVDG
ncbi:MAG: alpha/beta hydrolase [Rhodothermales bacterium]